MSEVYKVLFDEIARLNFELQKAKEESYNYSAAFTAAMTSSQMSDVAALSDLEESLEHYDFDDSFECAKKIRRGIADYKSDIEKIKTSGPL